MTSKSVSKVEWPIFQEINFKDFKKHFIFLIVLSTALSLYTAFFAHMNNWLIFRASFHHLMEGQSLYQLYPNEHQDLFKYSPSFALLMAPLSFLPAWLGALIWNLSGAFLFLYALLLLPLSHSNRKAVLWIGLPEFIGSTQGFQSNIHMLSFLMLFWIYLESERPFLSSLHLLNSFFVKIFGIVGGSLLIFHKYSTQNPKILLKTIGYGLFSLIFLIFLPLPFIGSDSLLFQYQEWLILLKNDAAQSYGFSVMGFLHNVLGLNPNQLLTQTLGGLSLLVSYFYFRKGAQNTRLMGFVALCYFLIVFNHKSESPTFIIAMIAFGIHQSLLINQRVRWFLIFFTLGCVSFMYSDLFRSIKQSHLDFYCVKVWPFLILYPLAIFQYNIRKNKDFIK